MNSHQPLGGGLDRLYYSGKHHYHGVNLQGLVDPAAATWCGSPTGWLSAPLARPLADLAS